MITGEVDAPEATKERLEPQPEHRERAGKILLVSWSLPPVLNGSSVIVENLARQFKACEMIVAGEAWRGYETVPENLHAPVVQLARQGRLPGQHLLRRFKLPVVIGRLLALARKQQCSAIVAVYPNEFYLFAAYVVARILRLPFYPYFHNTYLENRSGFWHTVAGWLQPRVFAAAETVFVMSDGMRDLYEDTYPGVRFVSLVHSFNEPIPRFEKTPPIQAPLKLAYMGTLNQSNRDAMSRVAQVVQKLPETQITTYSGQPDRVFADVGLSGPHVQHTKVASTEVTEALRRHDILLFPHGFEGGLSAVEYQTIFPTRTIPFLLSGRPILAHAPPDCFLTRWLRKHDCAEIVDVADQQALQCALHRLAEDADRRNELVRNALNAVRQFHAPEVASLFRETLSWPTAGGMQRCAA